MKRITLRGWHRSTVLSALALAVALGTGLALAQTAAPTVPAAVSPENQTAAVEAFKKARDLFQLEKYAEAKVENDRALKLDPNLADAQVLRNILQSKVAGTTTTTGEAPVVGVPSTDKIRLLKNSDVSLIRFRELGPEDMKTVKGRIDRKVLDSFWNEVVKRNSDMMTLTHDAQGAFVNPSNFVQQVELIKDSGDASYMEKVEFTTDPACLLTFKKTVMPYVLQNCATAQCHGGDKAGTFRVIRPPNTATDQIVYTNFYILSMYSNADGKMIDRDQPEHSLLLDYALSRNLTPAHHPLLNGKTEIPRHFGDTTGAEYVSYIAWMKTLTFPRPNYGIIYEFPGAPAHPAPVAPATQPATHPAATRPGK